MTDTVKPPVSNTTELAMEAMRKDLHALLAKTQQIHDYLYGSPDNEYPARQQLRDQSARILQLETTAVTHEKLDKVASTLDTLDGRLKTLEAAEKNRTIHTGDALVDVVKSSLKVALGLITGLVLAWILAGGLTPAKGETNKDGATPAPPAQREVPIDAP